MKNKEQLLYFFLQGKISLSQYDYKFMANLQTMIQRDHRVTTGQANLFDNLISKYKKQLTKCGLDKAELQKAEYTRQVAVLEAQAKKDSAQQLADAEVIRASGVAKANQIIGDSLKDNREYLQYLYITGIEEGSQKGNVTIYVPTENGLPVPTLSYDRK